MFSSWILLVLIAKTGLRLSPNVLTAIPRLPFLLCVNLIASCLSSLLSPFCVACIMFMLFKLHFCENNKMCEMISVCWPNFTSSAFYYFWVLSKSFNKLTCSWVAVLVAVEIKVICCWQSWSNSRFTASQWRNLEELLNSRRRIIGNLSSNYEWSLIRTKVFFDSLPHNQHSISIQWSCRKATHVESNTTVMNTAAGLSVISNRCFKKLW